MSQDTQTPVQNAAAEAQIRALNVLIMAARVGQSKGAYTLEEAAIIREAIKAFETDKPAETAAAVAPAPAQA